MDIVSASNIGQSNASIDKQAKNNIIAQIQSKIIKTYEEKRDKVLENENDLSGTIQMVGYQECITDILKVLKEIQGR